jgi:hypothetical protein
MGGLVWTHDTLCQFPELFEISGFAKTTAPQTVTPAVPHVRVVQPDHPMLKTPYNLAQGVFRIPKARASGADTFSHPPCNMAAAQTQIILSHDCEPQGRQNFYLTAHESGAGRVAVVEVGHEPHDNMGLFEKQVLVNALHWVSSVVDSQPVRPETARLNLLDRTMVITALCLSILGVGLHFFPAAKVEQIVVGVATSIVGSLILAYIAGRRVH